MTKEFDDVDDKYGFIKSSYDQFKFEEKIMDCWRVTDDLKAVSEYVMENDSSSAKYKDTVANMLIGMEALYQAKFEKLFLIFEDQNRERYDLLMQLKERDIQEKYSDGSK